ncbi:unnamed protein product, partial [Coregonus sp. 'balchen']
MDHNDESIKRAPRRLPYLLTPVRVNTPDFVMWPTGKVHRRPRPSPSVQTPKIHRRPPIIVSCGQDQTSGDGWKSWNINPEPLSQRDYDEGISSSNSDDISIYSFTDCESESDDEDHERRTPPLKVKDEEDGKVTRLEVRDMVEDDDLSLHSFDESDFLRDDGNDASAEDSPEPPKEPQRKVASLKDPQLIIVAKPNIPLPASVSALKKVSRQMEVVPTVRPCRQQLDKKTQWTNTNEESLRRIFKNLASMELDLEEGLQTVNDGLDINQVRQKNEGCFRAWIEKWMGRRKEKNPKDEEMDREDKGKMGEELRALIQVMRRNCSESDLEAVDLDRWLNDLERLKVAFKKCTGKICEMSPGKVSGPVSGQTGLSPLVTSSPWTLAEALQALPSAVAPLSPEDDVEAKRIGKGKKKAKKGRRKPVIDNRRKMLRKVRKGCEKGQKESEEE